MGFLIGVVIGVALVYVYKHKDYIIAKIKDLRGK